MEGKVENVLHNNYDKEGTIRMIRYYGFGLLCLMMSMFYIHSLGITGEMGEGQEILGSCATRLIQDYNRTRNIELALSKINGYVIDPDEVFSFNSTMGPRSARRGYLPAPVLFHDKRSIQIGGGICQISSTLYNAALLADLEIIERHRHSSPITYLPLGLDATVSYHYKDLKFKNTHPFPIMIMTSVSEEIMTISITGKEKLPYDVEILTKVTEIEPPFQDRSSESGKEILRYRIKRKNGFILEKEYLGRDYYHPVRGEE